MRRESLSHKKESTSKTLWMGERSYILEKRKQVDEMCTKCVVCVGQVLAYKVFQTSQGRHFFKTLVLRVMGSEVRRVTAQ